MGADMARSIVVTLILSLLIVENSFAQTKPNFAGKWALDTQKTTGSVDGGNPPCKALVVGHEEKALTVICSDPAVRSVYSLTGAETSVPVGATNGKAKVAWEGTRLVVVIAAPGQDKPLRRSFYLDGMFLVVEQTDGSSGATSRAYYFKT
jgi:hypothetical protein